MGKTLPLDDVPTDTAEIKAAIALIFAEIDQSLERMDRDREEFQRLAGETTELLDQLKQQLGIA